MAKIVGYNRTHIVSGEYGNKKTTSCSGVPGSGTVSSAYIYVNLYLCLAVDENGNLYATPADGSVKQKNMTDAYGNNWDCFFVARASNFSLTFSPGKNLWDRMDEIGFFKRADWMDDYVGVEGGFGESAFGSITKPTDTSNLNGFVKLPFTIDDIPKKITEIDGVKTTVGTVYLCIPVCYNGTPDSDITLQSVSFTVSMEELLPYYPGAIKKSGKWMSANRTGGSLKIRKSNSWRDVKNYSDGSSVQGFIKKSGAWTTAAKIGEQ